MRGAEPPPVQHLDIDPQILATVRQANGRRAQARRHRLLDGAHRRPRLRRQDRHGAGGGRLIGAHDVEWKLRNHAWFGSFAPLDDPQIVVVVFNEHGGAGSTGAAPIAADLYRFWFGLQTKKPRTAA